MDEQQQILDLIKANASLSTTVAQCENNINNIGNQMRKSTEQLDSKINLSDEKVDNVITDLKIYKAIILFIGFLIGGLCWLVVNFDVIKGVFK